MSAETINLSTREFLSARLKLRPDLRLTERYFRGELNGVIEDGFSGGFYRLGRREYNFVQLMNGHRNVGQILTAINSSTDVPSINEHEASNLLQSLIDSELIVTPESLKPDPARERRLKIKNAKLLATLNPLIFKIPIAHPQTLFSKASSYCGFFLRESLS